MKTILLPTDFSDNAWNAIKYAIQLYNDELCTFYLFNTYTPVIYNVGFGLDTSTQYILNDAAKTASETGLKELMERIAKEFGTNSSHTFKPLAKFNTLVFGIKELLDEQPIDLIVMGTKGATGAKEVLFGSNTVHVFKHIKAPILAIPADFAYESPHEILFPTDLQTTYDKTPLNLLKDIAVTHNSRVNALHVSTGYELTAAQEAHKATLERFFSGGAYLYHEMEQMEVPEAIQKFQLRYKINMLAMINNKHSIFENLFFKSTINKIGFHLNIPFLVMSVKK